MFGLFCPYEYAPRGCSILFPNRAVHRNCFGFGDNNIAQSVRIPVTGIRYLQK